MSLLVVTIKRSTGGQREYIELEKNKVPKTYADYLCWVKDMLNNSLMILSNISTGNFAMAISRYVLNIVFILATFLHS